MSKCKHYKFKVVRLEVPEPPKKTSKEINLQNHVRFFYATVASLIVVVLGTATAIWAPRSIASLIFSALWLVATAWIAMYVVLNMSGYPQVIAKLRKDVEEERKNVIDVSELKNSDDNDSTASGTGTDIKTNLIDLATLPNYKRNRR